jgi:hypothetical protein
MALPPASSRLSAEHIQGKRKNNRAESSHIPIRLRERKMQVFRSPGSAQCFLAAHASVANTFSTCCHLISNANHRQFRDDAFAVWREAAELAAKSDAPRRPATRRAINPTKPAPSTTIRSGDPTERRRQHLPLDLNPGDPLPLDASRLEAATLVR